MLRKLAQFIIGLRQVCGFLGISVWYRRFINNFATVVFQITDDHRGSIDQEKVSMEIIKKLLMTAPMLINPDFERKCFLHCDASDYGKGAS